MERRRAAARVRRVTRRQAVAPERRRATRRRVAVRGQRRATRRRVAVRGQRRATRRRVAVRGQRRATRRRVAALALRPAGRRPAADRARLRVAVRARRAGVRAQPVADQRQPAVATSAAILLQAGRFLCGAEERRAFVPNGSIRSINRNGMQINHGIHGGRTVVSEHNGARIVTTGHGGYVQRAYVTRGGHAYYSRTYFAGGRYHVGVYRGYSWGGHAYYGWRPVLSTRGSTVGAGILGELPFTGASDSGVGETPWWGFYGGWWNPYPVYAAPYYWLTDYLISEQLQAAYAARQEANADAMAADAEASAGERRRWRRRGSGSGSFRPGDSDTRGEGGNRRGSESAISGATGASAAAEWRRGRLRRQGRRAPATKLLLRHWIRHSALS